VEFEEMQIFGEPELNIWTDYPHTMDVAYPDVVSVGPFDFPVTVLEGATAVESALVCVMDTADLYETGYTDGFGQVILPIHTLIPESLYVTVTAHNFIPHEGRSFSISEGAYVTYLRHVNDDGTGNGNGELNPGETVTLDIWVMNWGIEDAVGVVGYLSCANPYITMTDSAADFGTVASGDSVLVMAGYAFDVLPDCPDGELATFELRVTADAREEWQSAFTEIVKAANLSFVTYCADDLEGGDGDGLVEPGETLSVDLTFSNSGLAEGADLVCVISSNDPYLDLLTDSSDLSTIPPEGGVGNTVTAYEIHIHSDCPEVHEAQVVYQVLGEYSLIDTFLLAVSPGIYFDGMEIEGNWTHGSLSPPTYGDEWHWSTARVHAGSHSFKCGGAGTDDYSNYLDAGLVSSEVPIEGDCQLTFWHWMEAETLAVAQDYAIDASLVEVSLDGGSWTLINPDGGYPYLVLAGTGHPFGGLRGFSGSTNGWELVQFDLTGLAGSARFRFRFGTDQSGVREGWYIDDLLVQGTRAQDIDLDPWEIELTLAPDSSASIPLEIFNRGDLILDFTVTLESSGWLDAAPLSGQVAAHSSEIVTVTMDATGLLSGNYSGSLTVVSDDPDEPSLLVPVDLMVNVGICGDADGSEELTTADGYFILNYFGAGPVPVSCWAANVNGDNSLTSSDGFHLLNHFGAGPGLDCAPCDYERYGDRFKPTVDMRSDPMK
jgi:hypothetical protein